MSGHSTLAPSSAARWLRCPGSVALVGPNSFGGNFYTAEGTAAHWLGEQALRTGHDCRHWLGQVHHVVNEHDASEHWDIEIDETMCEYVQVYVDYCRRRFDEMPGAMTIEQRVDLSDVLGVPDQGGTADCVIADSLIESTLEVIDLKYGQGKAVYAEDNEQLMLYAGGALRELEQQGSEFDKVVLTIVQPRMDGIVSHTITPDELRAWLDEAAIAASETQEGLQCSDAEAIHAAGLLRPGDIQCEWCPAKARCPALAQLAIDTVFPDEPDALNVDAPEPAPPDTNAEVLSRQRELVPLIEKWCKAIVTEVQERTERGEMPGWVLEAGRKGARAWRDEEEAEQLLKKSFRLKNEQAYNMKLISPAQAEKVLTPKRWERAAELVTQSDGKPIAKPESKADPKKIIRVGEMFDEVQSTEDLI